MKEPGYVRIELEQTIGLRIEQNKNILYYNILYKYGFNT